MFFWIEGRWSNGTSTPISPRAIITPSAISRIESRLSIPEPFSIFAIIWTFWPPLTLSSFLSFFTSSWFLTKDAAMKSISCSIPKIISLLSFSLMNTWSTSTPEMLIDFLDDTLPPFSTWQTLSPLTISVTVIEIKPSSIKIVVPDFTSSDR